MVKRNRKRFISWVMTFLLLLSVFQPAAYAEGTGIDAGTDTVITAPEAPANPEKEGGSENETNEGDVTTEPEGDKGETNEDDITTEPGDDEGKTNEGDVTTEPEDDEGKANEGDVTTEPGDNEGKANEGDVTTEPPEEVEKPLPILPEAPILLNEFVPMAETEGSDKYSILNNLEVTLTQGEETYPILTTEPISVNISFRVPVLGDYSQDPPTSGQLVQKGDWATFDLGSDFKLVGEHPDVPLTFGGFQVGYIAFSTNSETGTVTAKAIFDGDDEVFNGELNTVACNFNATLEYTGDGEPDEDGFISVAILTKTFQIKVPPKEITYTVKKSGTADLAEKKITWTVEITATEKDGTENKQIDLAGYVFSDDLTEVGDYINTSFKVVGKADVNPTVNDKTISYTFPDNSESPQTVTFETGIPEEQYFANSEQTVTNTAELKKDNIVLENDTKEVTFTPKWIEKAGKASDEGSSGIYDPKNRTITWTITANHYGATLDNVVITDILPDGLTFQEATWQEWNGSDWDNATSIQPTGSTPETPNGNGEYELGTIHSKILLTIVTKVPDETYATGTKTYKNSASIRWDGQLGIGTGNIEVGIGYNAITKDGVADPKDRKITWTVTVDPKGQDIPTPKVYDLLVYGSKASEFNLTEASGFPEGIKKTDLTPQYNQKYNDTFGNTGNTDVKVKVHSITQNGVPVADLLEITDLSQTELNTFTFETLVVNPDIFAGNKTTSVWNTATLFSANAKLNAATDSVAYKSKTLSKEMLKRDAISDAGVTANDANNFTTNAEEGFDYEDKSVIFRLSVNADGMDLSSRTNADGAPLGKAFVTDTLPDGWEFAKIADGKNYLIFAGEKQANETVHATGNALDTVTGLSADFTEKTATFTFASLNQPYVILVKAKPSTETLAGYFSSNKTTTKTNTLSLTAEEWTTGVTAQQSVSITSQLLDKAFKLIKAGELQWTVEYKPYNLKQEGTKLEDTLPIGLDVRTNAKGELLLSDEDGKYITAQKLALKTDGSYDDGEIVNLTVDDVSYDTVTRVLSFQIPDSKQAYRFTYITDITGEPGDVSNKVTLLGIDTEQVNTTKAYAISKADGNASLQRNGWIEITKINGSGNSLPGAEFTLYTSDGKTVIKTGTTNEHGILTMRVIPHGAYILKETKAPDGYKPEEKNHTLLVQGGAGATVTTSLDGQTGADANKITVKNYADGTVGDLTITKTVAGNAADKNKQFAFTVTLKGATGTYEYIGNGVPNGSIQSGDTISLAHGQSITIRNVPKGTAYEVTEADYSGQRYSTTKTGDLGTIRENQVQTASFTNTRTSSSDPDPATGKLVISKTVVGHGADTKKKFEFQVTFTGANGTYSYTGDGVPNGSIKSGDTISLAHGQSITITGLPVNADYEVTEKKASAEGYTVKSAGDSGTISSSQSRTAAFTNTKLPEITGSLSIRKTVTGQGADLNKKFDFTITLTGAPDAYPYSGAAKGTLRSGDTISLADGESITITGLPEGAKYTVTEADYTKAGYAVSSRNADGTISANTLKSAYFTNKWGNTPEEPVIPETPETPNQPENPDDPSNPVVDSENVDEDGKVLNDSIQKGDGTVSHDGMPKTGGGQAGSLAKLGLFIFSVAFAALAFVDFNLRKKRNHK